MRTGELTEKVLRYYDTAEGVNDTKYIALTQVRAATGWADPSTADVMVMGNWPSSGAELMGFEVKISRPDWLNEVKAPGKATPTKKYCDRWWLVVADKSFVKEDELPDDWGMMAVVYSEIKVIKQAPKLTPEPLTHLFVASMLRVNNKEHIPIDVHKDKLKDAVRDAESACKAKYSTLLEYVRFLNKELGIDIHQQKYSDQWTASIRGDYHSYTSEQLLQLIRTALATDLDSLKRDLESIRRQAEGISKRAATSLSRQDQAHESGPHL